MSLSWPLSLADFFEGLPVRQVSFFPSGAKSVSVTQGGDVISHKLGARLWQGEVSLGLDYHHLIAAFEARLSLLEEPGASLLIYDRRKPNPVSDTNGVLLAGFTPEIYSVAANGEELALSNLPAGFVITGGDLLGFQYGAGPVRFALHRVVSGATANGAGITPEFQVTPRLQPGAAPGLAVSLNKPVCKAKVLEAEYGSGAAAISQGGTFHWLQTLR